MKIDVGVSVFFCGLLISGSIIISSQSITQQLEDKLSLIQRSISHQDNNSGLNKINESIIQQNKSIDKLDKISVSTLDDKAIKYLIEECVNVNSGLGYTSNMKQQIRKKCMESILKIDLWHFNLKGR